MASIQDVYGHLKTLTKKWFYEKSEVDTALNSKQNSLVSGTNIKTINGESILGSGNITIQGENGNNNLEIVDFYYDETNDEYVIETGASNIGSILDKVYPIGSIYMSVNSTSPQTLFGGTWERIENKFLLASGSSYSNGATGGSATVSLSTSQMPRHNHSTNSHYHNTNTSGEYFITSEASGANNTRVTYSSSGNRYVDGMNDNKTPFHHRATTDSQAPSTKYTGGTGSTEAYSNGSAHENMPPYLAVNVWKRTA